ncbi:MAG: peptidase [Thermoprotei archaeon]|nr:MAG: peptidase [Thermoprotei archaeon]
MPLEAPTPRGLGARRSTHTYTCTRNSCVQDPHEGLELRLLEVRFPRDLLEGLLQVAKENHPREVFFLLRGSTKRGVVSVEEFLLPPTTTFGLGFSSFSLYSMPIDLSIVGTVHSHPSGSARPSIRDMHSFLGVVMVIVAYPYDMRSVAAYDREGRPVKVEAV